MHPAIYWWKTRARECGAHAACGDHAGAGGYGGHAGGCGPGGFAGVRAAPDEHGSFGVRRPLRFLAHKLDLREAQVAELARILNDLKTERAQAEVDDRRTLAAFADAVHGEGFDEPRAREGADLRAKSAERLRAAVHKALTDIHALLDADQRAQLAYLIRTGTLTL